MDKTIIEQLKIISEEFKDNNRPIPQAVINETIKILETTSDSKPLDELIEKYKTDINNIQAFLGQLNPEFIGTICTTKGIIQIYEKFVEDLKNLCDL